MVVTSLKFITSSMVSLGFMIILLDCHIFIQVINHMGSGVRAFIAYNTSHSFIHSFMTSSADSLQSTRWVLYK